MEGGNVFAKLGQIVPREREGVSTLSVVMPRLDRGIQYAAASRFWPRCLWNTGSPAFAGDDTEYVFAPALFETFITTRNACVLPHAAVCRAFM
jgi:hypothetical protein